MIDSDSVGGAAPEPVPPLPKAWGTVRVRGPSMVPTLRSGDLLLARFPSRPDLLVVKRVRRAVSGGHWVEGDNPLVTDDSRAFGTAVVVGRVVGRLWPRPGRLPPAALP